MLLRILCRQVLPEATIGFIGYRPADISKLLQNVVYHHLVTHGYDVTVTGAWQTRWRKGPPTSLCSLPAGEA